MIAYSIKKQGETNEKLVLRYKKTFFQTRLGNKLRGERRFVRNVSKRRERESAIIRELYRDFNNKAS
ncbi:MAG TPA: hypothetical protein PK765_00045 [bacterium]|nr:hypothetical protein [bacterium]